MMLHPMLETRNQQGDHSTTRTRTFNLRNVVAGACLLAAVVLSGCGGDAGASAETGDSSAATSSSSQGVAAAKAAGTVDTKYFTTVLPEGWEVMADDLDKMGLMTLAKKGTGGAEGVYVKFEGGGNFTGDPMENIKKFAQSYDGTPAKTVSRNGIDWAHTRYSYNNLDQSLNITAHDGYKVTLTVMGADYEDSPGVKAIFDELSFKPIGS